MRFATKPFAAILFLSSIFFPAGGRLSAAKAEKAEKAENGPALPVILLSGSDLWRNSAFISGGLLIAPRGFNEDGLLLKLIYSNGLYQYNAGSLDGARVYGREFATSIMPGWRIKRYGVEAKIFFGLDWENHRLQPDDPSNRLRGERLGARVAAEFWYEPMPATVLTGDVSLSTIAMSSSARLAYGWRVFDDFFGGFYIGPEVQHFASNDYRQWRIGSHITGFKTGNQEWWGAMGWAEDSDDRASLYMRAGFLKRY